VLARVKTAIRPSRAREIGVTLMVIGGTGLFAFTAAAAAAPRPLHFYSDRWFDLALVLLIVGVPLYLFADRFGKHPWLVIECGTSASFLQHKPGSARHRSAEITDPIAGVNVTRLVVRETNGAVAKSAHVQVVSTEPPPADDADLPAWLPWVVAGDEISHDLPPYGRAFVRLAELIRYHYPDQDQVASHVPGLDRGKRVRFVLRVLVEGEPASTEQAFVVNWTKTARHPEVDSV
jgi:hypothetical protein